MKSAICESIWDLLQVQGPKAERHNIFLYCFYKEYLLIRALYSSKDSNNGEAESSDWHKVHLHMFVRKKCLSLSSGIPMQIYDRSCGKSKIPDQLHQDAKIKKFGWKTKFKNQKTCSVRGSN
jgi:hypothetical protein